MDIIVKFTIGLMVARILYNIVSGYLSVNPSKKNALAVQKKQFNYLIKKDFDAFKNIIQDKQKAPILLKPPNFFYELSMNWKKIYPVVDDIIFISFKSGRYYFKVEFSKDQESGCIKINQLSGLPEIWWPSQSDYISKRITRNWDKANF